VKNIGVVVDAVNHPHRRRSEILQQGGRRVEVTLAGNFDGDALVAIAQASHYTFNAEFEQRLYDANLYVIIVCPPSYGRTDPVPENSSRIEQTCKDVIAVLDQLAVKSCPALTSYTSAPLVHALANANPQRINNVVQISTIGPIKFAASKQTSSSWLTGIVRASNTGDAMGRIIIRSAIKAWVTLGAKQFMRFQLSAKDVDADCVLRPENIKEFDHALTTAAEGGLSSIVSDHILAFGDWSSAIEQAPQKITIIHGSKDGLFTIDSVRAIAAAFPNKVTVFEIEDAGYSLYHSHTEQTVKVLRSVVDGQLPDSTDDSADLVQSSSAE